MGIHQKANELLQNNQNLKSLGVKRIDKRNCVVLIDKSKGTVISVCPSKDSLDENNKPEIRVSEQDWFDFLDENLETEP